LLFVFAAQEASPLIGRLVQAYPRAVYERMQQTLVSAGLGSSSTLLVERHS
jgi:hypothetical protein